MKIAILTANTNVYREQEEDKSAKVYSQSDIDEATRLCEESLKRSSERRAKRQQTEGYTLDEIFNGAADK